MTWSEFWHWMLLGEISHRWMHAVMAVVWLGLVVMAYCGKAMPHRTEWLMFGCWAFGTQLATFYEKGKKTI